ncbi:MAG: aldo/keto reductase [Chloroflexales bacterium]|nr:aldo/keto reductase [Chloroflexales bacterium]
MESRFHRVQLFTTTGASERLRAHYVRYCSKQPPYNLLDYTDAQAVPADSRAALRGGIYAERVTPTVVAVGQHFMALAQERDIPLAQLALAWVMAQPVITAPIVGPRTLAQLEHALPAIELRLDDELLQACDALVPPGSAVVNFHNTSGWMRQQLAW